ncbi:MAG: hypothetical protein JNL82_30325 [Myxococcales bacterium]|nr:hypothetical protein [Myxococcales bacterium]
MTDRTRVLVALTLSSPLACLAPPLVDCSDDACGMDDTTVAADEGQPLAEVTGASSGDTTGDTTTDDEATSDASGPALEDSAGGPPQWDSLTATPGEVKLRGPLKISAVVRHATEVELRLDGASLGTFAVEGDGKVEHALPIASEGQDGEHMIEAVARSPHGETPNSVAFSVDLPPGGEEQGEPYYDQEPAAHSVAFGLARADDRLFTLGALDEGNGTQLVLREHADDGPLLGKRTLADWTTLDGLVSAEVGPLGMDVLVTEWDDIIVAANLVPAGESESRGYLAAISLTGDVLHETLLAPGEEVEALAYNSGLVVAAGRKKVAGGRTVAMVRAYETANGLPFWEPVLVDVPDPEPPPSELRSARFHDVIFTNDGNVLAVGSTQLTRQVEQKTDPTRALFVRLSPTGELLGEPEIFTDEHFAAQTAALAAAPFSGPDGFCWTGWTRAHEDFLTPEMLVTYCQGESVVSRFSALSNSAGLSIAYTPLTKRIHVGGYRTSPGVKGNAWVMSFANGSEPLESPHGWSWEYDGAAHGFDEVTALACQTYDCDVLSVDDLLGESRVRLGRLSQ